MKFWGGWCYVTGTGCFRKVAGFPCLREEIPALVSSAVMNIKGSIFSFLQIGCEIPQSIGNMGQTLIKT